MEQLQGDLDQLIESDAKRFLAVDCKWLTADNIYKLASKLRAGKCDGHDGISSDCIIHGSKKLMLHIAFLFKSIIIHGVTPNDLLMGTMVPIPKVKGTANVSDKYRAITLSSCIGKLFDLLLLVAGSDSLQTDDLQFGFKANCSTSLCSSMLNEINNYFLTKGSNTYGLFLDASKAFDRVNFAKLFRLLIKRGLNSLFVKIFAKDVHKTEIMCHLEWSNYRIIWCH
jgi:hypothetical protein